MHFLMWRKLWVMVHGGRKQWLSKIWDIGLMRRGTTPVAMNSMSADLRAV
jgi:hypothetical protein